MLFLVFVCSFKLLVLYVVYMRVVKNRIAGFGVEGRCSIGLGIATVSLVLQFRIPTKIGIDLGL
jgi:hypothetical protein